MNNAAYLLVSTDRSICESTSARACVREIFVRVSE